MPPTIASFLASARQRLPARCIILDGAETRGFGQTTIAQSLDPPAVIRPTNEADILQVVALAREFGVSLYPVSCGKNWGYGSARSGCEGVVVLDCARMTRISDFDDVLGVVTVEPGVDQQQLSNFLIDHGDRWLTPTTGAGPSASILGNALERGYGLTPDADHFGAVQSLRTVLSDGRVLDSALAAAGAGRVDGLFKWGLGPFLDGLFTQSGLGIVTRLTLALSRKPRRIVTFLGKVRSETELTDVVNATREMLSQSRGVVGGINLMNQRRVVAMAQRPSDEALATGDAVSQAELDRLAAQHGIAPWTVMGALYGEPGPVRATARLLTRRFRRAGVRLLHVDEQRSRWAARLLRPVPGRRARSLRGQLAQLQRAQALFAGRPNEVALPLAYWRHPTAPHASGLNPARDHCGLIWYSPLVPLQSDDVDRFLRTTTRTCLEFGIDPLITLTSLSHRCFDCTLPLLFDAGRPGAAERARACYRTLFERNAKDGYVPYRLPITEMQRVTNPDTAYWSVVRSIKTALDPTHTISPGRYNLIDPAPPQPPAAQTPEPPTRQSPQT